MLAFYLECFFRNLIRRISVSPVEQDNQTHLMIEFLSAPPNMPFTIALLVMAGIAVLEMVSMLLGFALSHVVDSAIPGLDHDAHFDLDLNHDGHISFGENFLGWLHVGQVPVLILFILLLLGFGLAGVTTQWTALNTLGNPLPLAGAIPIAFFFGMVVVHLAGGLAKRTVLRDETTAISTESLVGHSATITLGATRRGTPSQAKLKDKHGQNHYVMVEPMHDDAEYQPGQSVMLVERSGHKFLVIEDSVEALLSFGAKTPSAEDRQEIIND